MPRVPVYQQQVRSRALPTPYGRTPDASGLRHLGAGFQQLGRAATDIALKAQDDANRYRVAQLDLEVGKAINDASYGEGGFLLSEGENAFTSYEERIDQLRQQLAEIESKAANDHQRQLLRLKIEGRLEQTRAAWAKHADRQRDRLFEEIRKAHAELAVETARLQFDDPDAVESSLQKVLVEPDGSEGVFLRDLRNRGVPVEVIDREVAALRAAVYGAALQGYLDAGDLEGARRWYDAKKHELGQAGRKFGESIAKAELAAQAGGTAAQLIERFRDPESGRVDEAGVRTALRELNEADPATRKAILDAIEPLLANEKKAWEARRQERRNLARGLYNRGGLNAVRAYTLPTGENLLDWLNRADAEYESKLQAETERRWRRLQMDERRRRSEDRRADDDALQHFLALDDEDQADLDVEEYFFGWGVSDRGLDKIREQQKRARGRFSQGLSRAKRGFVAEVMAESAGLEQFGGSSKDAKASREKLRAAAAIAYDRLSEKLKREPTEEELAQEKAFLLSSHITRERWILPDETAWGYELELQRQQEARESGGATSAAAPTEPAPRPSEAERIDQLIDAGLTMEEVTETLRAEGYR